MAKESTKRPIGGCDNIYLSLWDIIKLILYGRIREDIDGATIIHLNGR